MVPITLSDMENLPLLSEIAATEMEFLRRAINTIRRDRIEMKEFGKNQEQGKAMSPVVEEHQFKWFVQVKSMGEGKKAKQAFEMKVEGINIRARPRVIWEDKIERIGHKCGKTVLCENSLEYRDGYKDATLTPKNIRDSRRKKENKMVYICSVLQTVFKMLSLHPDATPNSSHH